MRHKSRLPGPPSNATSASASPSEKLVRDIRRVTRKHYSAEEKIRIVAKTGRNATIQERCHASELIHSFPGTAASRLFV